ncbi:hypothetical protein ACWD4P_35650, partial [Kitasatospora sp. NPDC002543]
GTSSSSAYQPGASRWKRALMRQAAQAAACAACGGPLAVPAPSPGRRPGGRPPRYCSPRCRSRAYRTRRREQDRTDAVT